LYSQWITIKGKAAHQIIVPNSFKGDVRYYIDVLMDNTVYSKEGQIEVNYSPLKLQIEYLSFRDKLLPGQEETWELSISDQFGKPLQAELLATLYDASLDLFRKNKWFSDNFCQNKNNEFLLHC